MTLLEGVERETISRVPHRAYDEMSAVDRHHNDHAHVTRAANDDDEEHFAKPVQIKTEAAAAAERTPFLVSDILTAASAEESAEERHMATNGFEAAAAAGRRPREWRQRRPRRAR